jgi:hypothetical protein
MKALSRKQLHLLVASISSLIVVVIIVIVVLNKNGKGARTDDESLGDEEKSSLWRKAPIDVGFFCDQVMPQLSTDLSTSEKVVLDTFEPAMYTTLLSSSPMTCPGQEAMLTDLRAQVKDLLQTIDARVKYGGMELPQAGSPCGFKNIVEDDKAGALYAPLATARFFQTVRQFMSSAGTKADVAEVRRALALWRTVVPRPEMVHPKVNLRMLGILIYDLDSALRFLLDPTSNGGFLTTQEAQIYVDRQKTQILQGQTSFVQALTTCHSQRPDVECRDLARTVHRWHLLQRIQVPSDVRSVLQSWGPPPHRSIVPLEWFDANCASQSAVLSLAPVRAALDFDVVHIPELKSPTPGIKDANVITTDGDKITEKYQLLLDTLDIINGDKATNQSPYRFESLYQAMKPAAGDTRDARTLLTNFFSPMGKYEMHPYLQSPMTLFSYLECGGECSNCHKASDLTCGMFCDSRLAFIPGRLSLTFQQDMCDWFHCQVDPDVLDPAELACPTCQVPRVCSFFISGPKLLFLDHNMPIFAQPFTVRPELSITTRGHELKYVMRAAIIHVPGHWYSVVHYGGHFGDNDDYDNDLVEDDAWFKCNMSECERIQEGFSFPNGVVGGGHVTGMLYERID